MKRAVLYARISGDDRPKDGRNLAGQLDMCREYALKNGWKVVEELAEDEAGASGVDHNLPQLKKILSLAEKGLIEVLIVREMDRLSRSIVKQILIEESLEKAGVTIEYVLGDYPDTAEGQLLKSIRTIISEYEREKIVERLQRGRRLSVKDGNVLTSNIAPYGYILTKVNGKRNFRIFEEEAEVIRLIFNLYAYGVDKECKSLSMRQIAEWLNDADINRSDRFYPNKHKHDSFYPCWSSVKVSKILRTETYIGKWHYGKIHRFPDGKYTKKDPSTLPSVDVPAVVDIQVWEAVQERREAFHEKINSKRRDLLLSKSLTCYRCGSLIGFTSGVTHSSHRFCYYICNSAKGNKENCSMIKHFDTEWLDNVVFEWAFNLLSSSITGSKGIADPIAQNKYMERDIVDLEQVARIRKTNLEYGTNLYLSGDMTNEPLESGYLQDSATINDLEGIQATYQTLLKNTDSDRREFIYQLFVPYDLVQILEKSKTDNQARKLIINRLNTRETVNYQDNRLIADITSLLGEKVFLK